MRVLPSLLAVGLVLSVAPTAARADEPRLVAVLPLSVLNGAIPSSARESLEEIVRTVAGDHLAGRGFTVLTGDNTLRVLRENGIDAAKACETECALDAARELNAQMFLAGSVSSMEGDLIVVLRLYEQRRGRQLASLQLEGATLKEIRHDFLGKADGLFSRAVASLDERDTNEVPTTPPPPRVDPVVESAATPLAGWGVRALVLGPTGALGLEGEWRAAQFGVAAAVGLWSGLALVWGPQHMGSGWYARAGYTLRFGNLLDLNRGVMVGGGYDWRLGRVSVCAGLSVAALWGVRDWGTNWTTLIWAPIPEFRMGVVF